MAEMDKFKRKYSITTYATQYDRAVASVKSIRKKTNKKPALAIVCGSGLGGIGEYIKEGDRIEYHEIEVSSRSLCVIYILYICT